MADATPCAPGLPALVAGAVVGDDQLEFLRGHRERLENRALHAYEKNRCRLQQRRI